MAKYWLTLKVYFLYPNTGNTLCYSQDKSGFTLLMTLHMLHSVAFRGGYTFKIGQTVIKNSFLCLLVHMQL